MSPEGKTKLRALYEKVRRGPNGNGRMLEDSEVLREVIFHLQHHPWPASVTPEEVVEVMVIARTEFVDPERYLPSSQYSWMLMQAGAKMSHPRSEVM